MKWISGIRTFLGEVGAELKKCTWPTKSELYDSTVVVIVSLILMACFIFVSDTVLSWLTGLIIPG